MQPEIVRRFAEVVWQHTEKLDKKGDQDNLRRFQTSLAYMLTQRENAVDQFTKRPLVASQPEEMARLTAARAATADGLANPPQMAQPLPTAIGLWPVDENGALVGILPKGAGWMNSNAPLFVLRDRDGEKLLGYFEHSEPLEANHLPLVSTYARQKPKEVVRKPRWGVAFVAFGFLLFTLLMGGALKTGGNIADGYQLVVSPLGDIADPDGRTRFEAAVAKTCADRPKLCGLVPVEEIITQACLQRDMDCSAEPITALTKTTCKETPNACSFPSVETVATAFCAAIPSACQNTTSQELITATCAANSGWCSAPSLTDVAANCRAQLAPSDVNPSNRNVIDEPSQHCHLAWDEALRAADTAPQTSGWLDQVSNGVIWAVTFLDQRGTALAQDDTISLSAYFIWSMAALGIAFAGIGLWTVGRWNGLVVNKENRVSLSLVQIAVWTIVVMSAYSTFCAFNVGAMGARFNEITPEDQSLFPAFEGWIWGVLGITIASPFVAALIKNAKPDAVQKTEADALGAENAQVLGARLRPLMPNASITQASFSDLFLGEDAQNVGRLDISRAQNVVITFLLLFTFTGWLVQTLGAISTPLILGGFVKATPILSSFPDPGGTFIALLGLTHGAYLAGKLRPA